jgi:2-hydroxy-3-keto-5-methylthiopentenyl-1-phosphate phosphatase
MMSGPPMAVLSDFDGTIVSIDTAKYVLDRFAAGDWKGVEERFARGEITLEQCMGQQFAMITIPPERMIAEIDAAITVRAGFGSLVEFCRSLDIPMAITSSGLDFYIRHFLEERHWAAEIGLVCPRMTKVDDGYHFVFPPLAIPTSTGFKDDMVRRYQLRGYRVIYIGDGIFDFPAARVADMPFAVQGSRLASLLEQDDVDYHCFTDFQGVLTALDDNGLD